MSFARTVKKELVSIPVEQDEMLAEFSAFLNMAVELSISNMQKILRFKTNNPSVAQRFLKLIRSLYNSETRLITKKEVTLNRKQTIIIDILTKVDEIINEHDYFNDSISAQELITQSEEAKKAFLRAAFLVSGSVNHPKTAEYHLEIYDDDPDQMIFIQTLMNFFNLNAKINKRRKGYIVYLKEAAAISDFIQITGARNAVFQFEDIRIKRDFNNSINRVMNCEIANEKKSIMASNQQIKDIELILSRLPKEAIDEKMEETIKLRQTYPDANLRELVDLYEEMFEKKISKSGLNHRFLKIKQLADELRGIKND